MCTVSWLHQDDGYQLFCNRDEKKTRAIARRPEVIESGGVRFIAPIDRAGGGTWIAVNEYALSLCLLNGSNVGSGDAPVKSRGHIVMELATATCLAEACARVWQTSLLEFAPFQLVLIERGRPAAIMAWDGVSRSNLPYCGLPLSSSSVDDAGARQVREREFRHVVGRGSTGAEAHLAFHRSHGAQASAYSPCMHRSDAETVSFTCIQVTGSEVMVHYSPASLCRQFPVQTRLLSIAS
jgi:hypothetical protein